MSLVIAIKDKDRIIFGSDTQTSTGGNKSHDSTKIWEVQDLPNAIMGSVGTLRASQVIQYNKIIDINDVNDFGGINTNFVINSLVPAIVNLLRTRGVLSVDQDKELANLPIVIPNTYLFAFEDSAWMIWNDLSVTELRDYLAVGSGSDVATGSLFSTKKVNPFSRIITAIDAAAETTLFVDNGVDILATKYYQKDYAQIEAAINKSSGKEDKNCYKELLWNKH